MRPVSVAVHPRTRHVYVVDRLSGRVRKVAGGRVTSVTPRRLAPSSIGFDRSGRLLVVEASEHRVWRQLADKRFVRVAGSPTGRAGFSGDGGPAARALLRAPSGVAADGSGNLYIADRGNHRVRRVAPNGRISTFAGNGADIVIPGMVFDGTDAIFLLLPRPTGITYGAGRLFVQSGGRVLAVDPASTSPRRSQVTYLGSPGDLGNTGDGGPAHRARISDDVQLAMAGARLVVLDRVADRIRRVAAPAG
jgi:DNA-binding beta-propeller fold protein YncE